jgi:hypothetical protein
MSSQRPPHPSNTSAARTEGYTLRRETLGVVMDNDVQGPFSNEPSFGVFCARSGGDGDGDGDRGARLRRGELLRHGRAAPCRRVAALEQPRGHPRGHGGGAAAGASASPPIECQGREIGQFSATSGPIHEEPKSPNVELIGSQSVRQRLSRASFRCGLLSVRREAKRRVTIHCWHQRRCGAVGVHISALLLWWGALCRRRARDVRLRTRTRTRRARRWRRYGFCNSSWETECL